MNIQNTDNKCFQYCVASHFCRDEKDKHKITKRLRAEVDKLNWNEIKFSAESNNIYVFEKNNQIKINVYNFDDNLDPGPLLISQVNYSEHINLSLITSNNIEQFRLTNSLNPFISSTNIELPEIYKNAEYVLINTRNKDDKVCQYCVARHFYGDEKKIHIK